MSMGCKVVIADVKEGKCLQKEIEDIKFLIGKKIGDSLKGELFDLTGYEFQITGGSDKVGIPLRGDVDNNVRSKILSVGGVGVKPKRKGQKIRKTVAGGIISDTIAQLNLKTTKYGPKSLFEAEAPAEEAAAEEKPAEEPAKEE
jgi:small subunit ribosomal protein S6e